MATRQGPMLLPNVDFAHHPPPHCGAMVACTGKTYTMSWRRSAATLNVSTTAPKSSGSARRPLGAMRRGIVGAAPGPSDHRDGRHGAPNSSTRAASRSREGLHSPWRAQSAVRRIWPSRHWCPLSTSGGARALEDAPETSSDQAGAPEPRGLGHVQLGHDGRPDQEAAAVATHVRRGVLGEADGALAIVLDKARPRFTSNRRQLRARQSQKLARSGGSQKRV